MRARFISLHLAYIVIKALLTLSIASQCMRTASPCISFPSPNHPPREQAFDPITKVTKSTIEPPLTISRISPTAAL
uniref:Secreted protein n=1 Tax=Arundo donax TaxID=35708 RepID=A0A0A9CYH4_ARUDO